MTVEEIDERAKQQEVIHATAKKIRQLLDKACEEIDALGGEPDGAEITIIQLVTEE